MTIYWVCLFDCFNVYRGGGSKEFLWVSDISVNVLCETMFYTKAPSMVKIEDYFMYPGTTHPY